jgi:hypothetical protein
VILSRSQLSEEAFRALHARLSDAMVASRRTPYLANVVECWLHVPGVDGGPRARSSVAAHAAEPWTVFVSPPGARNLHAVLARRRGAPLVDEGTARDIVRHVVRGLLSLHEGRLPVTAEEVDVWRERGVTTWKEEVAAIGTLHFREASFVLGTSEPTDVWVSGVHDPPPSAGARGDGDSVVAVNPLATLHAVLHAAIGGLDTIIPILQGPSPLKDSFAPSELPPGAPNTPPEARSPPHKEQDAEQGADAERLVEPRVTTKSDIWGVGRLVAAMMGANLDDLDGDGIPHIPAGAMSKAGREFVALCMRVDPLMRPSASQLLDTPWINGADEPDGTVAAAGVMGTITVRGGVEKTSATGTAASPDHVGGVDVAELFRSASETQTMPMVHADKVCPSS